MNRLVLIGNGFDIAHGLNTRYRDFINWYWDEFGKRLLKESTHILSDQLCSFILKPSEYYSTWFQLWSGHYIKRNNPFGPCNGNEIVELAKENKEICYFKYTSPFFEQINKSIETQKWVDIENIYYSMLIQEKDYGDRIKVLNSQMDFLRGKLIEYLKIESQQKTSIIEEVKEKIYCPLKEDEIAVNSGFIFNKDEKTSAPNKIMLLNFNYTNTPQKYIEGHSNVTINYIHGHLDDSESVIFGYGDELDETYHKLKAKNNNECLRHIKSINYMMSDNYRRVSRFVESGPFQICIMGHSCGNSDRTLLNKLFEHRNCVSIKPYFYKKPDGSDDYFDLVANIYRNFSDPQKMRNRVVNKTYTEPLTKPTI